MSSGGGSGEEGQPKGGDVEEEEDTSVDHSQQAHLYEESPPPDMGKSDFLNSGWFIDAKWRLIIEPPKGRKGGKLKAFVVQIEDYAAKRSVGKKEKKVEVILINKYYFDPNLYSHWDRQGLWKENQDVKGAFSKCKKEAEPRKSKKSCVFVIILCRGYQQAVGKGVRGRREKEEEGEASQRRREMWQRWQDKGESGKEEVHRYDYV